jgi:hypothetical protein
MNIKTSVRGGMAVVATRVVRGGGLGGRCGIVGEPIATIPVLAPPPVLSVNMLAV